MKALRMILAVLLLVLPLYGRAQKNLFEKYGDMKEVSSVYISRAMIESNPNLFTKDVYIGKVSGQLNSVQVLSTMDDGVKTKMRKDLRSLVQSSKYELLMKQKGVVSNSEFYMYRKGDQVKELIMIMDNAATLKFVYLEGDMTLKDIQRIMMYQNTSWTGKGLLDLGNNVGRAYAYSYSYGDKNDHSENKKEMQIIVSDNQLWKLNRSGQLNQLTQLGYLSNLKNLEGWKLLKGDKKIQVERYEDLKKYMDEDSWKKLNRALKKGMKALNGIVISSPSPSDNKEKYSL